MIIIKNGVTSFWEATPFFCICISFIPLSGVFLLFSCIEESLDTLLRSLLKFLIVDADLAYLAVGRNHRVELLTVLLHNLFQFASAQVQRLSLVEVWIYQSHQLVALLNYHALCNEGERIELILDFLRIDEIGRASCRERV